MGVLVTNKPTDPSLPDRAQEIRARMDAIANAPAEEVMGGNPPFVIMDAADREWLLDQLRAAQDVLRWLDRRGGLGYDAHERIAAALQARASSGEPR